MLNGLLPRMLPSDIHVRYLIFQGKQDLEKISLDGCAAG
jgi:hypothetical protein